MNFIRCTFNSINSSFTKSIQGKRLSVTFLCFINAGNVLIHLRSCSKLWWYMIIFFFNKRAVYIKIVSNSNVLINSLTLVLAEKRWVLKSSETNVPFSCVEQDPFVNTERYSCKISVGFPVLQYILLRTLERTSYFCGLKSFAKRTNANCFT